MLEGFSISFLVFEYGCWVIVRSLKFYGLTGSVGQQTEPLFYGAEITHPDDTSETFSYNAFGQMLSRTDGKGQTTRLQTRHSLLVEKLLNHPMVPQPNLTPKVREASYRPEKGLCMKQYLCA
ncbi:TPA: RHS repeat domain-containing protein [Pseudomonas putida]